MMKTNKNLVRLNNQQHRCRPIPFGHNSPKVTCTIKRPYLHSVSSAHLCDQLFMKNSRVAASPLQYTLRNTFTNLALSNSSHARATKDNLTRCIYSKFLISGSIVSSFVNV